MHLTKETVSFFTFQTVNTNLHTVQTSIISISRSSIFLSFFSPRNQLDELTSQGGCWCSDGDSPAAGACCAFGKFGTSSHIAKFGMFLLFTPVDTTRRFQNLSRKLPRAGDGDGDDMTAAAFLLDLKWAHLSDPWPLTTMGSVPPSLAQSLGQKEETWSTWYHMVTYIDVI